MLHRDKAHQAVRNALTKDGWQITDDPFRIKYDTVSVYADLRVVKTGTNVNVRRALVLEIKMFEGVSAVHEPEVALGQYALYGAFLQQVAPENELYLAVSDDIYNSLFAQKAFQFIVQTYQIAMVVINLVTEEVVKWIP